MVEIGAVLARRGSDLETINPELNFYRLVFVFFLGHAIGRPYQSVSIVDQA
jgi:hypothetical protein